MPLYIFALLWVMVSTGNFFSIIIVASFFYYVFFLFFSKAASNDGTYGAFLAASPCA